MTGLIYISDKKLKRKESDEKLAANFTCGKSVSVCGHIVS